MLMDEEHVEVTIPPRPAFTREQKFGYTVVIICGVLAVSLGVFYMSKHLKAPFIISYTGSRFLTGDEADAAEIARQKALDTDGDTVNDYDELNIYGSSPYLRDTDSDGMSDDIEIASNGDPACAKGAACADEEDDINTNTSLTEGLVGETAQDAAMATQELSQLKAMLESQTPSDIRAMLIDSGADKTQVDAMTDEEVIALYAKVLGELEASGGLEQLLQEVQKAQSGVGTTTTATATDADTTVSETPTTTTP